MERRTGGEGRSEANYKHGKGERGGNRKLKYLNQKENNR